MSSYSYLWDLVITRFVFFIFCLLCETTEWKKYEITKNLVKIIFKIWTIDIFYKSNI